MSERLVRRGPGGISRGCMHGYPAVRDCPRCDVRVDAPPSKVVPQTRWHATATTLGPRTKVSITVVLLMPVVVCLLGLSLAAQHVENAFLVVPLWGFGITAVVVLFHVWEPGQRDGAPTRRD